jgi:hypothetical protein
MPNNFHKTEGDGLSEGVPKEYGRRCYGIYRRNTEGIPKEYRRNTEGIPKEYRRNTEGILPKEYYRRNTTEGIPKEYRRNTEGIPKEYRRNTEGIPMEYRRRWSSLFMNFGDDSFFLQSSYRVLLITSPRVK